MRSVPSTVLAGLLACLAAAPALALQDPDEKKARQQAAYREKHEAALREPWFADYGSIPDYDAARERAVAGRKIIVAYFTLSWKASEPSRKFERSVLATEGFRAFAGEFVLFAHVESKIDGEKHPDLMAEKGGEAFPYVAALDAEGNLLARLEANTLDGLRAMTRTAADYRALRDRKDRTPAEELRLLGMDLDGGRIQGPEYRTRALALKGLDEAAAKERDARIVHLEVVREFQRYNAAMSAATGPDPALDIAVGKVFAGMWAAGRVPTEGKYVDFYCMRLMDYAESAGEADLFAGAMTKMEENHADGKRPDLAFLWRQNRGRLEKLRAAAGKKAGE